MILENRLAYLPYLFGKQIVSLPLTIE